jgi:release factor glutamine methyltransferase
MRLVDLLRYGEAALLGVGVTDYELDARLLLEHCTGKNRTEIFLSGDLEVDLEVQKFYLKLLEQRKLRKPVAYILGEQEFWSLPFYVSPDVLIPRPETEFMLDMVLAITEPDNFNKGYIVDLCCGSGVIATVLGKETGKRVLALDISHKALEMARKNSIRHGLDSFVMLIQGHLLSPFADQKFSLIVSNPPYVSSFDVQNNLMPEVVEYEPHLALDGGAKGLDCIREIRDGLPRVLIPGGQCFIEIGADQGESVKKIFSENVLGQPAFQEIQILVDYAGRDRVVYARLEQ